MTSIDSPADRSGSQRPPQRDLVPKAALCRHILTACVMALAMILSAIGPASAQHSVAGDYIADNEVAIYTTPSLTAPILTYVPGSFRCGPGGTPPPAIPFNTNDRYLLLACWSDDGVAQGLLHELNVDGAAVFSGNPLWSVAPMDSNLNACYPTFTAAIALAIGNAMAARLPTATWTAPAVGCNNPAAGNCYGVLGPQPQISQAARWTWFDSGNCPDPDAPFRPGCNHREFLVFCLDMTTCRPDSTVTSRNIRGDVQVDNSMAI